MSSVVPSARVMVGLGLPGLLALVCLALASCGPRQPKQLSVAQYNAIQQRLEAQASAAEAAAGPVPTPAAEGTPLSSPVPPKSDAERRTRAAVAVPAGVRLGALVPVGNGTRYVLSLATTEREGETIGPNLVLFDVSARQGVLLGEHDFGVEQPGAKAPTRIGRALLIDVSPDEPLVLAELFLAEGERQPLFGACGWWLRRRKATFVCAPRLAVQSDFEVHRGQLVESWSVDSVGTQVATPAGTRSGRKLRFIDGRWQEIDSFRCVGRPLDEAHKEAGAQPLRLWQQDTVLRLTKSAGRAADALETDVAISRLQDALAVDGCTPETWRLLGRLQFDAGRPQAAATLAAALALAPRDDAALIDLADALAVLDPAKPAQQESWHSAVAVLGSRAATRSWVDGAAAKSPRAAAAALYRVFLERTAAEDEWLAGRRRKVEQKLDRLEARRGTR